MKYLASVAIAAGGLFIGGCSTVSQVVNTGGDTKCKDFVSQDEKMQNDEITKMLKDRGKENATSLEISANRTSVSAYCKTIGTPDSKISEAPHL